VGVLFALSAGCALANGGPFVVKYPEGDPAAKSVLARLGPDLRPRRETQLRVVEEDLAVAFQSGAFGDDPARVPPLAFVSADYRIENPTDEPLTVDFGFPILRGVYVSPFSMMPRPDIGVTLDEAPLEAEIISNSAIYGIIRQSARRAIDRGLAADRQLAERVAAVADSDPADRYGVREALSGYLRGTLGWGERDAALMVEYAGLQLGQTRVYPRDRGMAWWSRDQELQALVDANLGPLAAIGEQKATQFLARLAARFEPAVATTYESLFAAWGGDVRDRAVDLRSGEVRPREFAVDPAALTSSSGLAWEGDPTIYARVDYLDETAEISEQEKAACRAILKSLPVVFTFAPMNLIHYQAHFPAHETHQLMVRYSQYAFRDTAEPPSFQLAYVLHPASMWDDFGPINLEVSVPEGVPFHASVPCAKAGTEDRDLLQGIDSPRREGKVRTDLYRATLTRKTGELFLAVDAAAWLKAAQPPVEERSARQQSQQAAP
jgi:hypothetical protein